MKNSKKLIAGAFAMALAAPMFSGVISAATSDSNPVPVTYDNSGNIPDPDHPTTATWAVSVPTHIAFTGTTSTVNTNVTLVPTSGYTNADLPTDDVHVQVKSANGFTMRLAGSTPDAVGYTLKSTAADGSALTDVTTGAPTANTAFTVANLNKDFTTSTGTATKTGTALETGTHTDTLTYIVHGI